MYSTEVLSEKYFKIFMGAYNDFRVNCREYYRFELDPLNYDDFLENFNKGIIKCIILLEGAIPTGFLAYSEAQENAIELYIIHCLGNQNLTEKRKLLLRAFLRETENSRQNCLVSYPMLGIQEDFKDEIKTFGFDFVNLAVLDFPITNKKETKALEKIRFTDLPIGYKIVPYKNIDKEELRNCIFKAFQNTSDVNFDPRFKSLKGADDITNKIVDGIYGLFLDNASRILLYENEVVGFCLANTTSSHIANIPLVGIIPEHRGLGLSEVMLKQAVEEIIKMNRQNVLSVDTLNVSTDFDNEPAIKMYKQMGFTVTYTYPQAFLPANN